MNEGRGMSVHALAMHSDQTQPVFKKKKCCKDGRLVMSGISVTLKSIHPSISCTGSSLSNESMFERLRDSKHCTAV